VARNALPFEVLEVLGEGAFGAVCVARLRSDPLRRLVAIKVLKASYAHDSKVLARLRDEARLLSRLHHPHILRVEQLVEDAERPVLVMELVRGLDVKTILRKLGTPLPAPVAMEILRRTFVALHTAYHEPSAEDGAPMRVIHRDIKPSNLLMSVHGQLKVADFGTATSQIEDREAKTDSLVMGSRAYMAPERLDGSRDTPAVDVYSAGMTLFELLTGRIMGLSVNPGSHDRNLTRHIDQMEPTDLSPDILVDLRRLVHRMCAYDADLRPSALVCATELERMISQIPEAQRLSLEEFASTTVQRLYDERKRVPLKKAIAGLEDAELLGHVATGTFTRVRPPTSPEMHRRPALFLGTLLGATVSLGLLAAGKAWDRQQEARVPAAIVEQSRVRFWFPSEANARVGALGLAVPGSMMLPPGSHELELSFEDGRVVRCPFEARDGIAVRYVVDRSSDAISLDDGPATACEPVTMARTAGSMGGG